MQRPNGALLMHGNERCISCAYYRATVPKSKLAEQKRGFCSLLKCVVSIWGVCEKWGERENPSELRQFSVAENGKTPPRACESCPECNGKGHIRGKVAGHRVICPVCRSDRARGQLALFALKPYNKPKPREVD